MKFLANLSRILTGMVFIFSGFVKGDNPLGTLYKFEDYLIAYHWEFLMPLALFLAIAMCTLEFTIGIMLIFNLRMKLASWLLLMMMVFFTTVTFFDALYSPVPDCGCFGDALILTNWQTFWKNVVLIGFALIVFLYRKKFKGFSTPAMQWTITWAFVFLFAGFSVYCLRHLPVIDFTEWKTGHKLYAENPKPVKYYLTYKDKTTGKLQEYLSPGYPYNDSIWMAKNEFVSQRVEDPNIYYGKTLIITDNSQNPVTESIIRNPGYQLVVNSYSLKDANTDAFKKISEFAGKAALSNIPTAVLVSAEPSEIEAFKKANQINLDFYNADDILLKTMVRSNPGIMLLKAGVIIDKWHWRDLPDFDKFIKKYPSNQQ
ncbi:MAG: DoxX family membrane protein [Bacteroidetes bacterium]|nr:DoxX family membrane protein [Bacteroidota bacterium]